MDSKAASGFRLMSWKWKGVSGGNHLSSICASQATLSDLSDSCLSAFCPKSVRPAPSSKHPRIALRGNPASHRTEARRRKLSSPWRRGYQSAPSLTHRHTPSPFSWLDLFLSIREQEKQCWPSDGSGCMKRCQDAHIKGEQSAWKVLR